MFFIRKLPGGHVISAKVNKTEEPYRRFSRNARIMARRGETHDNVEKREEQEGDPDDKRLIIQYLPPTMTPTRLKPGR